MDKPQNGCEALTSPNPFEKVMRVLNDRMQFADRLDAVAAAGIAATLDAADRDGIQDMPPIQGRYVVRDNELLPDLELVTTLLEKPIEKSGRLGAQVNVLGPRVWVHRIARVADAGEDPTFFIVEVPEFEGRDVAAFFLVDESDAVPYPFGGEEKMAVLAEAITDGQLQHRTDADLDEDFDREVLAINWEMSLKAMSPTQFTNYR